jgi:PPIC-type PPIASE domain
MSNIVSADAVEESSSTGAAHVTRKVFPAFSAKSLLREPLVHFLFLGALLFLFYHWRGDASGSTSNRIVITAPQIQQLAIGFVRTWQKPPTEAELKGLIDEYVKEEIATREAMAIGLDRDDIIIRRRLRQKLEFIAEDSAASVPPTDADLNAWVAAHPDAFRSDPKVAFRQVYLSPQRHGASLPSDAVKLLAKLRAAGPHASIDHLGDNTMLPSEQPLAPVFDTARTFGDEFANSLMAAEPGQWVGPLESSFGLHLVFVSERVPAAQQPLASIRPEVEREVLLERKKRELENLYARLLEKYSVKIELVPPASAKGSAK